MKFERAKIEDTEQVARILEEGRAYLKAQGVAQWQTDLPFLGETAENIATGRQYLVREGEEIAGVCATFEYEPDYEQIDGAWLTAEKYLAVHRVAVAPAFRGRGVPKLIYEGCSALARERGVLSLRADTHADNARMRATFLKNGFVYCGKITLKNGEPRLAYEKILKGEEQMQKVIVVASSNQGKLKEIREILSGWKVVSAAEAGFFEEVEETGETFYENALLKARAVCAQTGLPTLADDSGLCVDALNGAPGVYSARFSGKGAAGNRALLLEKLQGESNRRAHFTCSIVLCYPDGKILSAEGKTYGDILTEERGGNGFGYDPLFYSDDLKKTFAEATDGEKNAVSHRGRALKRLEELL